MRIARGSETALEPMVTDTFSGTVRRRDLGMIETPQGAALAVTFEPGARTHWHRHGGGQVIHVLEGTGRVATRDGGPIEIHPGDLVETPPGEEHWHGASKAEGMTHVALSFGETEWFEPASDD
ncbi:MAG: cupin domain-containing protein [Candidatus Limnocylindria bacterium]